MFSWATHIHGHDTQFLVVQKQHLFAWYSFGKLSSQEPYFKNLRPNRFLRIPLSLCLNHQCCFSVLLRKIHFLTCRWKSSKRLLPFLYAFASQPEGISTTHKEEKLFKISNSWFVLKAYKGFHNSAHIAYVWEKCEYLL